MDPVSLALSSLDAVDTTVKRLQNRYRNHKENPEKLESLVKLIEKSVTDLAICEEVMHASPTFLCSDKLLQLRNEGVNGIKESAEKADRILKYLETRYFADSDTPSRPQDTSASPPAASSHTGSSPPEIDVDNEENCWPLLRWLLSRFAWTYSRFTRANKISAQLSRAEKCAATIQRDVQHLARELRVAEYNKLHQPARQDEFNPDFFTPDSDRVVLDFDSLSTLEGKLKAMLLATVAHVCVGYGSLCTSKDWRRFVQDKKLSQRFSGGIYFISFGSKVTEEKVIQEIVKLVNESTKTPKESTETLELAIAENYSLVKDAAAMAAQRLPKESYLILCDDIWSEEPDVDCLEDLKHLCSGHEGSRLVIVAKSSAMAREAGCDISLRMESLKTKLCASQNRAPEDPDPDIIRASHIRTYGISGEGGVGKSVVLSGLAGVKDVRNRFSGGIYFMSFGEEATTVTVTEQIARIVRSSNGAKYAQGLAISPNPLQNVRDAAKWFSKRPCLFLCDDIWESESEVGIFPFLKLLITANGHPGSRLVMTSRDSTIADQAEFNSPANTRDPKGIISKTIFFEHSRMRDRIGDLQGGFTFQKELDDLLEHCGGLPLLLAVMGRRLAEEDAKSDVKVLLANQVKEFRGNLGILREHIPGDYNKSLYTAVMMSVRFLDKKHGSKADKAHYSFAEMFCSLSILSKQGSIPESVLARLWKTDREKTDEYIRHFNRLRLVLFKLEPSSTSESTRDREVMLHDLTLDICRLEARSAAYKNICWHQELLNRYHEAGPEDPAQSAISEKALSSEDIHRSWWSNALEDDGYIHSNLSRHLVAASRERELWSLLLNPLWSQCWVQFGMFLPLQKDLLALFDAMNFKKKPNNLNDEAFRKLREENDLKLRQLKLIYRALRCAWGRIENIPREYPYQMLGRLLDASSSMDIVQFFLQQVENKAEKPWLKPLNQCLEDPREGAEIEIHFKSACPSLTYFPSGDEVAAAIGNEIHVIELECGTVQKKLIGHSAPVEKVAVSADGTWIASADKHDIRRWGMDRGNQVGDPIACNNGMEPKDGSFGIRDNTEIFNITRRKLKSWKLNNGQDLACNFDGFTNYVAFSSDGCQVICAEKRTKEVTVRYMDKMSKVVQKMPYPHDCGFATSLAVSPDGKSIACGTNAGEILFWDRSCKELQAEKLHGHEGQVVALEISKNAKLLFSGSDGGNVRMWDLGNRNRHAESIGSHTDSVTCLTLSPDGTRLVSGSLDLIIRVWDVKKRTNANEDGKNPIGKSKPVTCIGSSPDGKFVISGSEDNMVRVWNARTGKLDGAPLAGHEAPVSHVEVSADSSIIYSWSVFDICWYMKTREPVKFEDYLFKAHEEKGEEYHRLSIHKTEDGTVECVYKDYEGHAIVLAQMPREARKLKWHIDHERDILYVGRQNGMIMHLQVER